VETVPKKDFCFISTSGILTASPMNCGTYDFKEFHYLVVIVSLKFRKNDLKRPVASASTAFDDEFDELPTFSSVRATSESLKKTVSEVSKGAASVKVPKVR